VDIQLHSLLTSTAKGNVCWASCPGCLTPGENIHNTHGIGGWVGPHPSLANFLFPNIKLACSLITVVADLSWIHYINMLKTHQNHWVTITIYLSQETHCAVYADTSTTILAIYVSTQASSSNSMIITATGGMSITLTRFTLCAIRWCTSTPWKLIVERTAAITCGTTSIMLAFTLGPL
jgi:hypothetical protein